MYPKFVTNGIKGLFSGGFPLFLFTITNTINLGNPKLMEIDILLCLSGLNLTEGKLNKEQWHHSQFALRGVRLIYLKYAT